MKEKLPYELFEGAKPINFYRYKSCVTQRIYQITTWNKGEKEKYEKEIKFFESIRDKILKDNDHIHWDNKVAIEFKTINNGNIFLGCFDDSWSIGFERTGDSWITPIKLI